MSLQVGTIFAIYYLPSFLKCYNTVSIVKYGSQPPSESYFLLFNALALVFPQFLVIMPMYAYSNVLVLLNIIAIYYLLFSQPQIKLNHICKEYYE